MADPEADVGNPNPDQPEEDYADETEWKKKLRKWEQLMEQLRKRKYLTNLIIAPSQTLSMWSAEIEKFFSKL